MDDDREKPDTTPAPPLSAEFLSGGTPTDVPLNDFEQSVYDRLTREGLKIVGQVGTSRYRIDLAVMHPIKPGRYVFAIECDGASYHSAPTARDRDRLRQQQLEALGWRFHRIWSTDWFLRREDEVRRLLETFERAVREADNDPQQRVTDSNRNAHAETPALPIATAARARRRKPLTVPGRSIDEYSAKDLHHLVEWVLSDGGLATDDEIITELTKELGFQLQGNRIVARLKDVIRSVRPIH